MGRQSPPENQLKYRKAIIMLISGKTAAEVANELPINVSHLTEVRASMFSMIQHNTKDKRIPYCPTVTQLHKFRPWLLPFIKDYFIANPIELDGNPIPYPNECQLLFDDVILQ